MLKRIFSMAIKYLRNKDNIPFYSLNGQGPSFFCCPLGREIGDFSRLGGDLQTNLIWQLGFYMYKNTGALVSIFKSSKASL